MRYAIAAFLLCALAAGCSHQEPEHEHEGHRAPHGGVLNAIESCAVGHIEAVLEGKKLTLYFLGGHDRTDTSLPVKAENLELDIRLEDGSETSLKLAASPLKLAGEEVGRCSRFEGESDFLEGTKKFEASGQVEVGGEMHRLTIRYPEGFHPGHKEGE